MAADIKQVYARKLDMNTPADLMWLKEKINSDFLVDVDDLIDKLNKEFRRIIPYESNIKRAIFNPPATIILWNDGTKSVVKCQNGEWYDPEKGFALAYLKKLLGNDNTFNKEINKWVDWSMYDE